MRLFILFLAALAAACNGTNVEMPLVVAAKIEGPNGCYLEITNRGRSAAAEDKQVRFTTNWSPDYCSYRIGQEIK